MSPIKADYAESMTAVWTTPPSIDDIEAIARDALSHIPPALRRYVTDVVIRVEEFVDEETEQAMSLDDPFDILGLYHGVSMDQKSVTGVPHNVDMIFLYRRAILDYWCETGEELTRVVRHVLIHEIGHHFGLSDADMERIENEQ